MFVSRKKYDKLYNEYIQTLLQVGALKEALKKEFKVTTNYLLENRITVQGTCTVAANDKEEAIDKSKYEPQLNKEGLPLVITGNLQLVEVVKVEEVLNG